MLLTLGPVVTGWMLIGEFIFTLAMALKCYPLQPGGLLALEAVLLGLTSPHGVYQETLNNFEVILPVNSTMPACRWYQWRCGTRT